MNQYFGAITMLIRMCEAQNITVRGQPPNPLDSLPPNLSLGHSTIPETSLPENLQHPAPRTPRWAVPELSEHRADEKQKPTILQRAGPAMPALVRDVESNGAPLLTALKAPEPPFWRGLEFQHSISQTQTHTNIGEKILAPSGCMPEAMLDLVFLGLLGFFFDLSLFTCP